MRKRIISALITISMLMVLIPSPVSKAAGTYNVSAALSYAAAHWNDGVGLCADFVSACLRAGGVNANQAITGNLRSFLVNNGYATDYFITSQQSTRVKMANYPGKIAPGDVIINYCTSCHLYPHVMLVAGTDSNGNVTYYAHNSAANRKAYWNGSDGYRLHPGHSFEMHVLHMNNSYSDSGSGSTAPAQPTIAPHVHSWQTGYDSGHPHREYRKCTSGCGSTEYTGGSRKVTSCKQCYPLGSARLTRDFNKVSGTATFYRNNVSNANDYTLTLYKDGSRYGSYDMSSTSKTVWSLPPGYYTASLSVSNKNTGETKTASSSSFTIVNTYNVSCNANGGSGAPSSQTKIQDTNLTLSSTIPKKTGHIFKGWASSKTAKEAQYAAGGTYTKNAKITLYAVWEPETYIIKFDANGGKGELADTTITYGNTLRMPNSVVKDGFYLKGWSTNKNATNPDYRANMDYKLTANTQLYAVWGSSTWGGTVATEFAGGDGTEENPYQISNAGELAYLAKMVNSRTSTPEYKYYILTDNISLGYEEWMPIGIYDNENQYFKGSFDGNGFTISDLSISQPNSNQIGIFGHTTDSTIKNLTVTGDITGVSSTAEMYIGAISGYSENLNAENCIGTYINISDISTTDVTNTGRVGSLFGYAITDSVITDCKTNECFISVKSGRYTVGNIVGRLNGTIKGCEVKAENELIGATADTDYLTGGGIAGTMSGTIEECRVKAGYLSSTMRSKTYLHAGGLVGYMAANSVVKLCSVNFKGDLTRTIDNGSYPASMIAVVSGTNNTNIGGLLGVAILNTKIEDCIYNGESISATSSANVRAGGAIGYSEGSTTEKIAAQGGIPLNRDLLPKRDGYKATWYTDSDFKNEYDFTQNVSADTTLYAKWEEGEEEQPEIWDGTTKQPAYNASTKTYTVTNGAELAWIAALVNGELELDLPIDSTMEGYTVELANDIYLNDISDWGSWSETNAPQNSWTPIGKSSTNCFKGTFNGNNHAVKGIYIYANGGADNQVEIICNFRFYFSLNTHSLYPFLLERYKIIIFSNQGVKIRPLD